MGTDLKRSATRRMVAIILIFVASLLVWLLAALVFMTFFQPFAPYSL
jgi:hypothetical protein